MTQKSHSALQPSSTGPKSSMAWLKKAAKRASKNGKLSQVKAKQALKLLAGEGKEPVAFEVGRDGSFRIELASKSETVFSKGHNPWDKALTDD